MKKDHETQLEAFKQAARTHGADEDEAAFKEKLAAIARQKPKDDAAPKPKAKNAP